MYNNNHWAAQQIAAVQLAAAMQFQMQQQEPRPPPPPTPHQQHLSDSDTEDDPEDEQQRTLFCANLDDRMTEELLYEAFLQAGPIESVRIPKDNVGKQRSFGFVAYVHSCSARYAMQLYQGLAFFRRTLTIKYQGSTNPTRLTQHQRYVQPTDVETYRQRRSGSGGRYDNSSLRGSSYPSYYDTSMNATSPTSMENPFHQQSPDWVKGSSGGRQKERISKHSSSQSRPHLNASPYQRPESTSRRSGGSDSHGDDFQRRYQRNNSSNNNNNNNNNGSNRRSEQRGGHHRR